MRVRNPGGILEINGDGLTEKFVIAERAADVTLPDDVAATPYCKSLIERKRLLPFVEKKQVAASAETVVKPQATAPVAPKQSKAKGPFAPS